MTTFYFGVNNKKSLENVLSWGVRDVLVSFAYAKQVKYEPEELKEMGVRKLFIDSGAFSIANSGLKLSEEDYIAYLRQHMAHITEYVVMDATNYAKPDDSQALWSNKVKALKSIRTSYKDQALADSNREALERFWAAGLDPIGVWHGTEPIPHLQWMVNECSKVGVSGVGAYIDIVQLFQRVAGSLPTHGFGFTRLSRFDLVKRFDSVDSVSWSEAAKYSGFSPHGRFKSSGDFGGHLWQMSGFTRWQDEKTGKKVTVEDIKDYDTEADKAEGLRSQRMELRQQIAVKAYLRRLHGLGILDYEPPAQ